MPFDTRIRIDIQALGHRDEFGEYVDGPTTSYNVWADESGAGSGDTPTGGGLIVTSGRTFVVRWFRALDVAIEPLVTVVDNVGLRWYSDGISKSDARKRFIVVNAMRQGEGFDTSEDGEGL